MIVVTNENRMTVFEIIKRDQDKARARCEKLAKDLMSDPKNKYTGRAILTQV